MDEFFRFYFPNTHLHLLWPFCRRLLICVWAFCALRGIFFSSSWLICDVGESWIVADGVATFGSVSVTSIRNISPWPSWLRSPKQHNAHTLPGHFSGKYGNSSGGCITFSLLLLLLALPLVPMFALVLLSPLPIAELLDGVVLTAASINSFTTQSHPIILCKFISMQNGNKREKKLTSWPLLLHVLLQIIRRLICFHCCTWCWR